MVLTIKIGTNEILLKEMLTTATTPKITKQKNNVEHVYKRYILFNERETNTIQMEKKKLTTKKRTDLSNEERTSASICSKRATNVHVKSARSCSIFCSHKFVILMCMCACAYNMFAVLIYGVIDYRFGSESI